MTWSTPGRTGSPAGPRPRCWPRNSPGCTRSPATPFTVAFGTTRVGAGQHADGGLRVRPVLGAAPADGRHGVGPGPRPRRRRAGRDHPRRRRTGRSRSPATRGPPRAPRSSTTPTSRPPRQAPWNGPRGPRTPRRPSSSASVRAPGCGWSRPPPPAPPRCGSRWLPRSSSARLFTPAEVDWALGHAAVHGRFAEADLASILDHHRQQPARDRRAPGQRGPLPDPGHQRLGPLRHQRGGDPVTTPQPYPSPACPPRRRCRPSWTRCCAGCGCPTSAATPPR